jgi:EmrB/QacA subfamily drug resistance transporter
MVNAYTLALAGLLLLGGTLGDRYGRRRIFIIGTIWFAVASLVCALAPTAGVLILARALQGVGAALLTPGSLAILQASFVADDRSKALGAWSGLGGIATAIGPFLGGYLIDSVSWRWVFVINLPLSAVAVAIALRHVPESRDEHMAAHLDLLGSALLTVGLAGLVYALIEGPGNGWSAFAIGCGVVGVLALLAWGLVEARGAHPMVPLGIFKSRQFSGANGVTFAVYAALGAVTFLLVVHLQTDLGYSALEAGASLLPLTACMLLLSARAGALAQRIGPRWPMTIGPLVVAAGMVLLGRIDPGSTYWATVFPATVVLGLGLSLTVAPLTATVLGAVEDAHAGIASAINNSVARIAGLLAVAVLPAAAGLTAKDGLDLDAGFSRAMDICAVLAAVGAVVAFLTIRRAAFVESVSQANPAIPCYANEASVAGSAT